MINELRSCLVEAHYTTDSVLAAIGETGQAGLRRNCTIPASQSLVGDDSSLATLIRLFPLGRSIPLDEASGVLPVDELVESGLLVQVPEPPCITGTIVRQLSEDEPANQVHGSSEAVSRQWVKATVNLVPYSFETKKGQWDGWVISDPTPGLDYLTQPTSSDHVLGVSPASTTLAQLSIDTHVQSALDLGTGCAVQSLHLSTHADRIVATDVNPRALRLARCTAQLNQVEIDLRAGSLYDPVADDSFDLIVTNTPYVMSPPQGERLIYRETGFRADDLVRTVVANSLDHLNPGGRCEVLANWAITDQNWQDRLAEWAPAGADMWVIERERLDPFAYIEMWLTDAGLAGEPVWHERYREWLDYFDSLGIREIGMGWITVSNSGRTEPDITIESWPHEVHQPVGPAIAARQDDVTCAQLTDAELLARSLRLRQDVVQETLGTPGAADPQYLVMRQHSGLKRAFEADTPLAGVFGACDGTLPLAVIIDAVCQLLELDSSEQRPAILRQVRQAIMDGYFDSSGEAW